MSSDAATAGSPLDQALQRLGGPSLTEVGLPPWQLDTALRLALRLAELPDEDLGPFREAMYTEVRRRLFPQTFSPPSADAGLVATYFIPLAGAVIEEQVLRGGEGTAVRLPFVPLADSDISPWPSGEEYRRLLRAVERDGLLACLAMAQEWFGLSIFDHVLGVTGLSLHLGRQLARAVAVDLPLLHGAAIGHDIGKFGCAGDEVRRIPRLHYYYTHVWYQARDFPGLGHIATNHSCWDLELIRLPIETQLLIYADFRIKEVAGADGTRRMTIISLREAYHAIRDKLENVDDAKLRRYEGVYRKLRDLEDYLLALGVELDPPGFATEAPEAPRLPRGLDVVQVVAGKQRPDVVALATGSEITTVCRFFATAHNIGVMERLRDVPALKALLEEARSFERWRDLRTYIGVLSEYAPALSQPQKELALDFFFELLGHRDDDIRYHAANRIGDLLALGEEEWRKDLPAGVVPREGAWVEHQLDRLFALLDRAGPLPEQDMGPTERVLYAIPILLRRLIGRAEPGRREALLDHIFGRLAARRGDRRPLVGLYVCESCEVLLPHLDGHRHALVLELAREWSEHEVDNVRLMAWRVLVFLARRGDLAGDVRDALASLARHLGQRLDSDALVAELFLLGELAARCRLHEVAERCRDLRERDRQPLRDVMLRNLKTRVGWVEKKINCDYLVSVTMARVHEGDDPGSLFANEVASHLANLLKVSRVEGTRFHAGRCLLQVLPPLAVTQHNDLMVELLRSLELDVEAVTRYIPRFLGTVLATLPVQEFDEGLDDIQLHVRRGSAPLQRLLLQTVGWVIVSLPASRLQGTTLRRLAGIVLGALGETRASTVHEAFAQIAMVIERLLREASGGVRVAPLLSVLTKKLLSLVTHQPADRSRFFLIASALSHLEMGLRVAGRRVRLPARPTVAFMPGTFDPFTTAHAAVVTGVLEHVDELLIQVDDYSWNKHAQPRETRKEFAWMALAPVLGAFLSPLEPPINLANPESVRALRRRLHGRVPTLVVGSDVVGGASAYRDAASHVWALPHVVAVRKGSSDQAWQEKLQRFRAGARVLRLPPETRSVSSTTLRSALDHGADLEGLCDPLIARTLTERQLYVNYPSRKEPVRAPRYTLRILRGNARLPADLPPVLRLDDLPALARWTGRPREVYVLAPRDGDAPDAALSWRETAAAALPFLITEVRLKALADGRLSGLGALVDGVAAAGGVAGRAALPTLLSRSMARWLDAGLQFALIGVPAVDHSGLTEVLQEWGAAWLPEGSGAPETRRWAWVSLSDPLVLLWDFESVLQPHYAARPEVGEVIAHGRRDLALFFARRKPGSALFHLPEREAKRVIVEWARARLAEERRLRQWVILGLGRQFLRDVCGDVPTVALDLERFLTVQGYDAGIRPSHGSPTLEMQLHTVRELGHDAMLLTPFLEGAEKVLMVRCAARAAGVTLREVLIGVTSADVHATLHLEGVVHRCGAVVPRWQGVIRESALAPYVGGWSILGREALEGGSLLPSLNDCLPYHHPHPLGLDGEAALDFSRLALNHTRRLFLTLEEMFRATEGRLLGVRDLPFVVRTPRCPPFPQGFEPPSERLPSELLAEDIEALARLHPETHAAHRHGWRGE